MDLNKILAFARKRKLELRKLRLDVERQHRKDANDYRRTYRAISDFLEEGEDLLRSLGDTSEFDKVDKVRGMDIIFVTTAKTDEECMFLLQAMGMPFEK